MHPPSGEENAMASAPTSIMMMRTTTTTTTTTTAAAAMATALFATTTSSPMDAADSAQGECRLLGSFALLVQAALGALALLSLVYKRWRERPQRPLKIWFFDVSKQVFGSVLVHVANIFMSMLTSGRFDMIRPEPSAAATQRLKERADDGYTPNPCSFYLLNLAIDTTVGIPILIILLRILTGLAAMTPLGKPSESIQSGNYGSPPNAWWWLKQSIIYFCGLFGMKLCVLVIFVVLPWISVVGDWALGWTAGNERLQIAFVMMIFPLVMNALQYYIIDSFIKKKETVDREGLPQQEPDEMRRHYDDETCRLRGPSTSEDEDEDEDDGDVHGENRDGGPASRRDYDPRFDGHAPTVIGIGPSQRASRIKLPTELYPKE
ncbi:vaculolar membrane protein [Ophiocordyceps camponoti-floridani]|uniref:Vaculolar membrane protein n=1 Tax=Ophiocordyceps camponoti-floridani TaxID=2030778 RepID=A0A8H4VG68_9HYPO|nr:vaculolar membrane protein [Ophiocordyceps camponoti-floridani]